MTSHPGILHTRPFMNKNQASLMLKQQILHWLVYMTTNDSVQLASPGLVDMTNLPRTHPDAPCTNPLSKWMPTQREMPGNISNPPGPYSYIIWSGIISLHSSQPLLAGAIFHWC